MRIIKLLSFIALVGSIGWFFSAPDYEPAIAIATSLIALIGLWVKGRKDEPKASQTQKVGKDGIGIQAAGNVNIGRMHVSRKSKDAQ